QVKTFLAAEVVGDRGHGRLRRLRDRAGAGPFEPIKAEVHYGSVQETTLQHSCSFERTRRHVKQGGRDPARLRGRVGRIPDPIELPSRPRRLTPSSGPNGGLPEGQNSGQWG